MFAPSSIAFLRTSSAALPIALPETTAARLPQGATPPSNPRGSPGGTSTAAPELAGIAGDDEHVLRRDADRVGRDLRERRLVALALRGEPGRDEHLARDRVHLHVRALVGAET